MVNPGSFQGARKAFLLSQKAEYALAVKDQHAAETLSLIQRRFFKRFPIDLPDDFEPTEAQLALVNDDAPDAVMSDPESTGSESDGSVSHLQHKKKSRKAKQNSKSKKKRIAFRREASHVQIKRWMAYQYGKDNTTNEKEHGAFNPYKILLPRFVTGLKNVNSEPRRRPALNIWRQTKREEINSCLQAQVELSKQAGDPIPPSHFATRREKIARAMYTALSDEEKQHWEMLADEQHELAKVQHKQQQEDDISTTPADRQSAIQRLPGFIQPILDLICDVTGWKATLIAGGPEPALHGQFSIMSVHSGLTNGPVPMNFGTAQRANYKKNIIPVFGKFLQLCYEPDECRSRALNPQDGFLPMATMMSSEDTDPGTSTSAFVDNVELAPIPTGPAITANYGQAEDGSEGGDPHEGDEGETDREGGDSDEGENPFQYCIRLSPQTSLPPSPALSPHQSPTIQRTDLPLSGPTSSSSAPTSSVVSSFVLSPAPAPVPATNAPAATLLSTPVVLATASPNIPVPSRSSATPQPVVSTPAVPNVNIHVPPTSSANSSQVVPANPPPQSTSALGTSDAQPSSTSLKIIIPPREHDNAAVTNPPTKRKRKTSKKGRTALNVTTHPPNGTDDALQATNPLPKRTEKAQKKKNRPTAPDLTTPPPGCSDNPPRPTDSVPSKRNVAEDEAEVIPVPTKRNRTKSARLLAMEESERESRGRGRQQGV